MRKAKSFAKYLKDVGRLKNNTFVVTVMSNLGLIKFAKENDIKLQRGVYAQLTGPSFESPAEIKMLRTLGVDAVGMSTVVEAIAANHMGMKICGISCVCNLAAGMTDNPLTHEEVQAAANEAAPKFKKLLTESVKKFGSFVGGIPFN